MLLLSLSVLAAGALATQVDVPRWSTYEVSQQGPEQNESLNPFKDVEMFATFTHDSRALRVRGFYDGVGAYKVRFMPDEAGLWQYVTKSNQQALDGITGSFSVVDAEQPKRSPVRVRNQRQFEHAGGAPHFSVGTTSYAWIHQADDIIAETVSTLKDPATPFNKMRMTVFPKWYWFNHWEPSYYPYEGTAPDQWDFSTFNVDFWKRLDQRVLELMEAGIEADIILFHPYDNGHWGFDCMGGRDARSYDTTNDEHYLQYVVARLGAYRNVWWSMANEWDFVECKKGGAPATPTWDRLFQVLDQEDVHKHLKSIHNGALLYNHSQPWITHLSFQGKYNMAHEKRRFTLRPVVWDEVMYEGDIGNWGGLTGGQMADRFWWGLSYGIYVGHGETITVPNLKDDDQVLWWSKGGELRGNSPARIRWFRDVASTYFDKITCTCAGWGESSCDDSCHLSYDMGDGVDIATDEETFYILHSSAYNQPAHGPLETRLELPEGTWELRPVDFWNMRVLESRATLQGGASVTLTSDALTFPDLIDENSTAPCGRSSATCCSSDAASCTPFAAMLVKAGSPMPAQSPPALV